MANFHAGSITDHHVAAIPHIRKIGFSDLMVALRQGAEDFWDHPSHYLFLALIYPVAGVVIAAWTASANVFVLLYPLAAGFALLGPFAAVGLYEVSRRRELGIDASWQASLEVFRSHRFGGIAVLGVMLMVLFMVWLAVAQAIYSSTFGDWVPHSPTEFFNQIFGTDQGWTLIVVGNVVGALFAIVALATTVISVPLLVDRNFGVMPAIQTSIAAVAANPLPMAAWGIIVAVLLAIGMVPLFVGLALVLPILGHATWRLYRRVVAFDD